MSIAEVRISRSAERLAEFCDQIALWNADESLTLKLEMSDDRRSWRLHVEHVTIPAPAELWASTLGEVAHLVRSGLNNVVYAVAERRAAGPLRQPADIQFPIASSMSAFNKSVRDRLGEAHDVLIDIVRAFQPFGSGPDSLQPGPGLQNQHPLALLADFNNADKHRRWLAMPPTPSMAELGDASDPVSIRFDRDVDDDDFGPIEALAEPIAVGSTVLRQVCRVPIRELKLRGRVRLDVAIQTDSGPVNAVTLATSWVFVGGLVMLRMEDVDAPIAVIYQRLESLLK